MFNYKYINPRAFSRGLDVVYLDTPAIDDGSTSAAVYSGGTSHVLDVFGMKSNKQFVNTLEDIIRDRGAPTRLLSDHAITLRSSRVLDVLQALCIGNGQASRTAKIKTLWNVDTKP
jgi:hypothetical protein